MTRHLTGTIAAAIGRRRWAKGAAVILAASVLTACGDAEPPAHEPGTTTPATVTGSTPSASVPVPVRTSPPTTAEPSSTPPPVTQPPSGVPAHLRGQDLTVVPTTQPVVALTFDAGANAAGLPSILATLSAQGVHATFFLTGQWATADPAGVASIRAGGHRIGNHSMTHPEFTGLSTAQIRDQVLSAQEAILGEGADPRPLFRFPFGDRDERTITAVNDLGYVPVRWSVDTLGWKGTSGGVSAEQVADRAVAGLQPGEIVLMHIGSNPDDGSTLDADALPGMITRMRAAGYDFATLDAVLD